MVIQKASAFDFPTYQLFINSAFVPSDRFLTARVDRSIGSIFQRMRVGKASFDLDNEHQDFSPARYFDMGGFMPTVGNSSTLRHPGDFTGNADTKVGIVSLVFKALKDPSTAYMVEAQNARWAVRFDNDGLLVLTGADINNADVMEIRGGFNGGIANAPNWNDGRFHHLIGAWDLDAGLGQLYIDGNDVGSAVTIVSTPIDVTRNSHAIGGRASGNVAENLFPGICSFLYINFAQFLDMRSETNLRKMVDEWGRPVNYGANASTITGSTPIVFLPMDNVNSLGINKGSGGDYTSITDLTPLSQYQLPIAPYDLRPGKSITARAIEGPLHLPFFRTVNSADWLQTNSGFVGAVDGPSGILSCWINRQSLVGSRQLIFTNEGSFCDLEILATNILRFTAWQVSPTTRKVRLDTSTTFPTSSTNLHHVLAGWDTATGSAWLFVDDEDLLDTGFNPTSTGNIDYTRDHWKFGRNNVPGANGLQYFGSVAECWFDIRSGNLIDLSSVTNRRKWVSSDARPVNLGLFGENPLGYKPTCYVTFADNDNIGHNLGTGANSGDHFTDNRSRQTNNGVHQLFTGKMDRFDVEPILGKQATKVTASDAGDLFRDRVEIPFRLNTSVASLAVDIGSAVAVSSTDVSTVPFNDVIPFADLDDISAGSALDDILHTGAHRAFITAKNVFRVQHRNAAQFTTAVLSASQFFDVTYRLSDDGLINKAEVTGQPRVQATETKTIAFLEDTPTLAQSQTFDFHLEFMDFATNERGIPVTSPITPVKSLDYLLTIGEEGDPAPTSSAVVSLEIFARSAKVSVTNVEADPAILASFGIRGVPIERRSKFRMTSESSSSQNIFGKQEFDIENDLIGSTLFARSYAEWLVFQYDDPLADISVTFRSEFGSNECLALELDDRIHLTESHTMIKSLFNVTGIKHTIRPNIVHNTVYEVSLVLDKPYLILDDLNLGTIDSTNILGF